ncbi:hypothetical protein [Phormidesmis priestleyi]|nr:hypothetical protein [Phormidesmis priestleyi]
MHSFSYVLREVKRQPDNCRQSHGSFWVHQRPLKGAGVGSAPFNGGLI